MRDFAKGLGMIVPMLALAAGGSASASGGANSERALTLRVMEDGDRVEVQLIAQSRITQQVQYEVELVGSSRAHHSGDTSIPAGNRQVLSRLTTTTTAPWCATVHVTEQSGERYTITAGDCA